MSITTIFIYLIYSLILFLIIEYLNIKNKTNSINNIVVSLIYLIIISGITPARTYSIFLVIILELLIRIFYTNYILEKNFLKQNRNNLKTYLITIVLSYILNITFINKVDSVFPTPDQLKTIIWLAIIIFVYIILKDNITINNIIEKKKTFNDKEEYIITEYAKLKNKYSEYIITKYQELIPIIYSLMVYENYYKPSIIRKLDIIKFKIDNEERKLGIMQIKTKKIITDEESIELAIKKLEKIYDKIFNNKKIKKDNNLISLIKEYTKEENNSEEVIDIYNKIVEFNKK